MIQTEREYAEALFTLAVEENAVEEFLDSLVTLKQLFDENPDYIEFLNSPAIPLGERTASIDEAFDGKMPQYVVSFIKVLCENGKMRTILLCIDEFETLARAFSNRAIATVYSAVELSGEQKDAVCKKLEAITNKRIDPIYIIDESLIGGMKIEVDGKTFDGSIKHRLGDIKDVMNS
ncbi:MAG: ATP synthase F1 subunit delta [Clostridia bacterium]|nr:ATP synthase F1 subunit delta [Clostridia bacterium]